MKMHQKNFNCTFVIIFTIIALCAAETHRVKRKVAFSKSSKIFFRLNGKDNVLNHTEIFAHGWTVRVNFDLPENIPRRYKFFKRDIHNEIENIPNEKVSMGISCILKQVCDFISSLQSSEQCGMFCKIGEIVARTPGIESDFFKSFLDKCDYHTDTCLYSFKDSSIYHYT